MVLTRFKKSTDRYFFTNNGLICTTTLNQKKRSLRKHSPIPILFLQEDLDYHFGEGHFLSCFNLVSTLNEMKIHLQPVSWDESHNPGNISQSVQVKPTLNQLVT